MVVFGAALVALRRLLRRARSDGSATDSVGAPGWYFFPAMTCHLPQAVLYGAICHVPFYGAAPLYIRRLIFCCHVSSSLIQHADVYFDKFIPRHALRAVYNFVVPTAVIVGGALHAAGLFATCSPLTAAALLFVSNALPAAALAYGGSVVGEEHMPQSPGMDEISRTLHRSPHWWHAHAIGDAALGAGSALQLAVLGGAAVRPGLCALFGC